MADLPIVIRPAVLWEDDPEMVKATVGRSVYTLKRWSSNEGLTVYTRGKGTGKRDYWLLDEVVAFLRTTGITNHEIESAADGRE